ncbi:transcriptional regulator, AraC family [Tropicimonas sediminicola]|uniref:Transcriptional regulator, AraC family n=2 Tax=Tropicimonas sediminicola TaxID=1031541 RepID=A0A239F478_9RHOB|nr:transcriptional regulator, AraC family [Tropicimonas sediminicola]
MARKGERADDARTGVNAAISRPPDGVSTWERTEIRQIEDLGDAIKDAGFEAIQMPPHPVKGSIVFREQDDIRFSCGRIFGHVCISGALPENRISLAVGLRIAPGSRLWHQEIHTGVLVVLRPGDRQQALFLPGTLYAAVTMPQDRLMEVAAEFGLSIDERAIRETGFRNPVCPTPNADALCRAMDDIHDGALQARGVEERLLGHLAHQVSRNTAPLVRPDHQRGHTRIVSRACCFIDTQFDKPLTVDDVADAAMTSRRTLYRAFREVMGQPPHVYLRTMRLHRMRQTLLRASDGRMSVTRAATISGLDQFGRVSGSYRDLFGELPSQTLAGALRLQSAEAD